MPSKEEKEPKAKPRELPKSTGGWEEDEKADTKR